MAEAVKAVTYRSLLQEVERLLEPERVGRGQVERERVQRYWEVGGWIEAVVAPDGQRAPYGAHVLGRLAMDMDLRARLL